MSKKIYVKSKKYSNIFAIVDDEDFKFLNKIKWYVRKSKNTFYIQSQEPTQQIHRLITKPPKDMIVDHINHNGLDNRKCNLRICTKQQNSMNRPSYKGKSKYKGVYPINKKEWIASITFNNQKIKIGIYSSEKEAALSYNYKAKELFKEFACLNNI